MSKRVEYRNRRRWTATDARAALDALESSGLTASEFASREGLDVERLRRWRRSLAAVPTMASAPAFIEVHEQRPAVLEIVLRSGVVVRVPDSIEIEVVAWLLKEIGGASSC